MEILIAIGAALVLAFAGRAILGGRRRTADGSTTDSGAFVMFSGDSVADSGGDCGSGDAGGCDGGGGGD